MTDFFTGEQLYGDQLTVEERAAWYAAELNGYHELPYDQSERYPYHGLNTWCGFRHVHRAGLLDVVGIGSSYGIEMRGIARRIKSLRLVEPSEDARAGSLYGVVPTYVEPDPSGRLNMASASADLVTCFGVLHHVSAVSISLREIFRVMRPGGQLLLREPIVSLGDWRLPRAGLTANERGLPLAWLLRTCSEIGYTVHREYLCLTPLTNAAMKRRIDVLASRPGAALDVFLAARLAWNYKYHAEKRVHKIRPTNVFLVLGKE